MKFWANMAFCCLLLIVFVTGVQAMRGSSAIELLQPPIKISEDTKELLNHVKLTQFVVRLKKGENRVDAIFSFENSSEHTIDNIDIICDETDKDGRFLGRQKWLISQPVEMLSKKTLLSENNRMFIPKRASKIECRIVDMNIVHGPLVTVTRPHGDRSHDGTEPVNSSTPDHH